LFDGGKGNQSSIPPFRGVIWQSVKSVERLDSGCRSEVVDRFLAALDRTVSTFCVWFVYSFLSLPSRKSELVTRNEGGGLPVSYGLKSRLSSSGRIASPKKPNKTLVHV